MTPVGRARAAGLVGLITLVTGSFGAYVASELVVPGDAAATSANLVGSETLFRLGVASYLVMMIATAGYALLLFRLLRPVDGRHAALMLGLLVSAAPIFMLNQVNQIGALRAAAEQLPDQVALFLELHHAGNQIAGIFFGLWLLPLGLLVYRSRFLPRLLGALLLAGSPGYLVLFVQAFLFPGSERSLWTNPFLVVTHVSELALMLWLLAGRINADEWQKRVLESHARIAR